MPDKTRFDEAWEQWRQNLTADLRTPSNDVSPEVQNVLRAVGAFDPDDGLIRRDWALGMLSDEGAQVRELTTRGLSDREVRRLVAVMQRHPTPAAGG